MQTNVRWWSLGVLITLASVGAANAADGAWNVEASGNWSDSSNWTDGVVAAGVGNTAYFTNAPSVFNRPTVSLDTNLFLNGLHLWQGDVSVLTIAADRVPGTLDYYSIDIGSADLNAYASRPVDFKAELKGTGAVRFSGVGMFSFCHPQSFTGPMYYGNRSSYKSINYSMYAHSAATVTEDLLATEEVYTDYSTLTLIGRYPRAASSGRSWELIPGGSSVRLLDSGVSVGSFLTPGQVVTGEHVRDGTFIQSIRDSVTIYLNQTLADDFSEAVTQTLAFAAAPRWDVVQQFDRLVSQSSEAAAVGGVQLRPCVAGGYGTNTVTLRVGELAGNRPVRVTVNNIYGGSDGRMQVDRAEKFTESITLENTSALMLGDQETIPTAPALDAAFWVDSGEEASITKDLVGNITRWNDKRGAGYPYAESWINTPEYMANALNGLPVVDFGPLGSNRGLAWDREITGIKVVFWVMGSQESGGTLLGSKPGYTTDYRRGFDALRAIGNTSASYVILLSNGLVGYNPVAGDYVAVNGREVALAGCGLSGGYDLVTVSLPSKSYKASAFAFDAYDAAGTRFSGGQRLAEVIVYTNVLSTQQIKDTEAYLYKKWFDRDALGYGAGKVDFMATATGADARIGQAGTQPVEARYVSHQGNLTVMSGSTVTLQADASLPKLTLEEGAKAILKARKIPVEPLTDGNILWLDAGRGEDFAFGDGNAVNAWTNRGGGSVLAVTPGTVKPERVQDGQGRWLVDMGERDNGCCLMTLSNLMTRSAFVVWFSRANGTLPLGNLKGGYAGHSEFRDGDFFRNGASVMLSGGGVTRTALGGQWFLDGQPIQPTVTVIPTNRLMLTSAVMQGWGGRVSALGGYSFNNTSATYLYSGGMQLAEVLLYDRTLDDDERRDVEAYLTRKWFGTILPGYADEDGGLDLAEVEIRGNAGIETRGNAVLRVLKVSGGGTLTTSGDSPVVVQNVLNPNSATVQGNEGTAGVRVWRDEVAAAPSAPASGSTLWFDAAQADSVTIYKAGGLDYAQYWEDRSSGVKAQSAYGVASWIPKYVAGGVNGLPIMDFEYRGRQRAFKWEPRLTDIRTVFWMVKDKGPAQGGGWLLGDTTRIGDFKRGSWGTLLGNSPLFDATSAPEVRDGVIHIDGVRCIADTVPKWDFQVISLVTTGDAAADTIAADRLLYTNWSGLEIGEVIIYTRALSDAECVETEDYLMSKWLGRRSPRVVCADTQTVVTASGTVPLYVENIDGETGTVAAFRGDGEVVLDGAAVTVLSDAESFSGRVTLRNDSTVRLEHTLFAATEWFVEEGSVLDLGGQTVTVAGIGGNGCVSNGTLVVGSVTTAVSGTLTFKCGLVLADGAVINVKYDRPQYGVLDVAGKLTVNGGGVVYLSEPIGLNQCIVIPLLTYDSIEGVGHLLADWDFDGDYSKSTYLFRLEHVEEDKLVVYKGFAKGTLLAVQ